MKLVVFHKVASLHVNPALFAIHIKDSVTTKHTTTSNLTLELALHSQQFSMCSITINQFISKTLHNSHIHLC